MKEIIKKIPFDTIFTESMERAGVVGIAMFAITIVSLITVKGIFGISFYANLYDPIREMSYITVIIYNANFYFRSIQYFILAKRGKL